jgi:hypothetical protein
MKLFIFIITFFICSILSFEITSEPKSLSLQITITNDGYDIYSKDGELLLEFTKQNCDKESLETLEYIYQTVEEEEK